MHTGTGSLSFNPFTRNSVTLQHVLAAFINPQVSFRVLISHFVLFVYSLFYSFDLLKYEVQSSFKVF